MNSSASHTNQISYLPPVLIDRIAAGEVIEAPFSVIKELVENSLDAGATHIRIETVSCGMERIYIEDNGLGITTQDLPLAVARHATSKIKSLSDLDSLFSFGFRGEALASIASVSHVIIQSKTKNSQSGARLQSRGGDTTDVELVACKTGTAITIEDLFYATPARRKYVKSERSENIRNARVIEKISFAHPHVRFEFHRDGKERFDLFDCKSLRERIGQVYHEKLLSHLLEVDYEENGIRIHGFITNENYFRANRDGQHLYINGRPVDVKNFSYFVKKSYGELLPPTSHPFYFLFLDLDPKRVDMNVHPQKKEVRLVDERQLHNLVQHALSPILRPIDPLGYMLNPSNKNELPRLSHSIDGMTEEMFSRPFVTAGEWPVADLQGKQSIEDHKQNQGQSSDHVIAKNSSLPGNGVDQNTPQVHKSFVPIKHFGTVFGTYIIAEGEDGLYIVDQHTAHERVNYEKKRKELESEKNHTQALLTPVVLDCSREEKEEILLRSEDLARCGFVVEDFGSTHIAIREVPSYIDPGSENEVLLHLIRRITEGETSIKLYDEYAALKACKASIRKNDYVAGGVISSILLELAACENPSRCPHGRPTMMKLTQTELDKMFHRI